MKRYFIKVFKRTMGIVILFLGVGVMIIPFVFVHLFFGLENANKMMDRIALYFINLLE